MDKSVLSYRKSIKTSSLARISLAYFNTSLERTHLNSLKISWKLRTQTSMVTVIPKSWNKFAVTLNFYSSQAYDFLRTYFHLPHSSIYHTSVECRFKLPAWYSDRSHRTSQGNGCRTPHYGTLKEKKEVVFEKKTGSYGGFIDCGNFHFAS